MKTKLLLPLCLLVFYLLVVISIKIIKEIENTTNGTAFWIPSEFEMASGLKEALEKVLTRGVNKLNVVGGFKRPTS